MNARDRLDRKRSDQPRHGRQRRRRIGRLASGAIAVALVSAAIAESHVFTSPGERFVDHLAREFERSRRNSRTFVLARLVFTSPEVSRTAARRINEVLRQSDVLGLTASGIYLLMPETDRECARLAVKRLTIDLPDAETTSIVEYPTDGITVGRLLEVLHDTPSGRLPDRDTGLEAFPDLPEAGEYGRDPAVLRAEIRQLRVKRLADLVVLAFAAPVVVPLGLLVAAAIRIDSRGKVMFVQERTGLHGHRFKMYKFRSMVHNAQELKASLQHLNILEPPDFKIVDDPRITRVGKFIRATSLDELPQLINVLRGDMTLVGPRPTSFAAETYETWHTQRLEVPPGITGLWQVSARHESGFDERLRLDVNYISSMSLWNDVRIVGRTFTSVLKAKGA
jgi:lipopolysaccharide/colanic/teichoic acid biosynthesis glycosyltransferase